LRNFAKLLFGQIKYLPGIPPRPGGSPPGGGIPVGIPGIPLGGAYKIKYIFI